MSLALVPLVPLVSLVLLVLAAAPIADVAEAASAQQWRSRRIYHVLTDRFAQGSDSGNTTCSSLSSYCGGTWLGLRDRLDYITGMGFNAVWISPHVDNVDGGYHGYWAQDFYATNAHFGTRDDLTQLIEACHERDVWVMLDVVLNHVGKPARSGDYSQFPQFDSAEYYHPACEINYGSQASIEDCWIAGLPDLAQEHAYVSAELFNWINDTIVTYKFDGLRVDTVKHVPKSFWPQFQQVVDAAGAAIGQEGTFAIGEVYEGSAPYVGDYTFYMDSVLSFPMYYTLNDVFGRETADMRALATGIRSVFQNYKDPSLLGNFVDNHDVVRFQYTQKDEALLRNAIAWAFASEGIPILYYGTEQYFAGGADPQNREIMWNSFNTGSPLYQFVQTINAMRSDLGDRLVLSKQQELYVSGNVYAFARTTQVDPGTCGFAENQREECGYYGITESLCEVRGCCWDIASTGDYPACFLPDTSSSYDPVVVVALTDIGTGAGSVSFDISSGGNGGRTLVNIFDPADRLVFGTASTRITLTGQPKIYLVQ